MPKVRNRGKRVKISSEDRVSPKLRIVSPAVGYTATGDLYIAAVGADNRELANLTFILTDGNWSAGGSLTASTMYPGLYEITVDTVALADGTYILTVMATDTNNQHNNGTVSRQIVIDNSTLFAVTVESPTIGQNVQLPFNIQTSVASNIALRTLEVLFINASVQHTVAKDVTSLTTPYVVSVDNPSTVNLNGQMQFTVKAISGNDVVGFSTQRTIFIGGGQSVAPPVITSLSLSQTSVTVGSPITGSFTYTGDNPLFIEWDQTSDGILDSALASATFVFTSAATETLSLRIYNAGGSSTRTVSVTVHPLPAAPVIDFTYDRTAMLEGATANFQAINTGGSIDTYSWTRNGTVVGALSSLALPFPVSGTFTMAVSVVGPGGSDTETKTNLIVVSAPPAAGTPPVDWHQLATFRSDTSGTQTITPFTVVFPFGSATNGAPYNVDTTQRANIWARYPNNGGGTFYPIQTEQYRSRADGKALYCTGHVSITGLASGTNVGIGYANDGAQPSPPNWAAITAAGDDFSVELDIYEPRVHYMAFDRQPVVGDTVIVSITDSFGVQTYSHTYISWEAGAAGGKQSWDYLAKAITQDPSGRYRMYDREVIPTNPPSSYGYTHGYYEHDYFEPSWTNSEVYHGMGYPLGGSPTNTNVRRITGARTYDLNDLAPNSFGTNIWPRWTAGNPENYTVDITINRAAGSSLSFYTTYGPASFTGTLATSGRVPACNNKSDRVTWTATFNNATPTANSPWFNGHLIYQKECVGPLMNGVTPHPHLVARFYVSWKADGTIVDRQVVIENTKMKSYARDYWYDANVKIAGVSQTSGQAKYRGLFHNIWTSWRWYTEKPFGMCDPADFMRARCMYSWARYPTVDISAHMKPKIQGGVIIYDLGYDAQVAGLTSRGYVKSTPNDPLYPGAWCFSADGGSRTEISPVNIVEWMFWTHDSLKAFPMLRAAGDNVAGAWGNHSRLETAVGIEADEPPDFYTQWDLLPQNSQNGNNPVLMGNDWENGYYSPNITQLYSLVSNRHKLIASHLPQCQSFSAYLAQPEKRYMDLQLSYAWCAPLWSYNFGNVINRPKTTAGATDHVVGYSGSNGVRTYAWPAREIYKAAALMFEGHPRRTMWRRVAQDMANHANKAATDTIWGLMNPLTRTAPALPNSIVALVDSTNWDQLSTMLPNDIKNPALDIAVYDPPDQQKETYAPMAQMLAMGMNAADCQTTVDRLKWPLVLLDKAPNNEWWKMLGSYGTLSFPKDPYWVLDGQFYRARSLSGNNQIWPDETGDGLTAFWAATTDPTIVNNPTVRMGDKRATVPWTPGYSYEKQQILLLYYIARYSQNATNVARANYWIDFLEAQFPRGATVSNNGMTFTYGQIWQMLDCVKESEITSW